MGKRGHQPRGPDVMHLGADIGGPSTAPPHDAVVDVRHGGRARAPSPGRSHDAGGVTRAVWMVELSEERS